MRNPRRACSRISRVACFVFVGIVLVRVGGSAAAEGLSIENLQLLRVTAEGSEPYDTSERPIFTCPGPAPQDGDEVLYATFNFTNVPFEYVDGIPKESIELVLYIGDNVFYQPMNAQQDALPSNTYQTSMLIYSSGGCGTMLLGIEVDGEVVGGFEVETVTPDNTPNWTVDSDDSDNFESNGTCDDLNDDGDVDLNDLAILGAHAGHSVVPASVDGPSSLIEDQYGAFELESLVGLDPETVTWYKASNCDGQGGWVSIATGATISTRGSDSFCLKAVATYETAPQFEAFHSVTVYPDEPEPEWTPRNTGTAPTGFALGVNRPNPFNPTTHISFDLPVASHVTLQVYDVSGSIVAELVDSPMEAGTYTFPFDGAGLASGVYFYRLQAGNFSAIRKMVLLK